MNKPNFFFFNKRGTLFFACLGILLMLISACSPLSQKNVLTTAPLNTRDLQGRVNLILYGGNYYHDLETIALIDIAGDGYEFEIYAPDFVYKVIKDMDAKDALSDAEKFLDHQSSLQNIRFSRILSKQGSVVGYEIRPLYYPFRYGFSDVLDVTYSLNMNKIVVIIRLDRSIERRMHNGNDMLKVN